jgi:hypothetical protein
MTDLTERERIKCAYLHCICGIEIMHLAIAYEVNMGRVSEAVTAIKLAAENPKEMRKRMEPPPFPADHFTPRIIPASADR